MNVYLYLKHFCKNHSLKILLFTMTFREIPRLNSTDPLAFGEVYMVVYPFKNYVLRRHMAPLKNFRPYIRQYTSPNNNFEYNYPPILWQLFCFNVLFVIYDIIGSGSDLLNCSSF